MKVWVKFEEADSVPFKVELRFGDDFDDFKRAIKQTEGLTCSHSKINIKNVDGSTVNLSSHVDDNGSELEPYLYSVSDRISAVIKCIGFSIDRVRVCDCDGNNKIVPIDLNSPNILKSFIVQCRSEFCEEIANKPFRIFACLDQYDFDKEKCEVSTVECLLDVLREYGEKKNECRVLCIFEESDNYTLSLAEEEKLKENERKIRMHSKLRLNRLIS